MTFSSRSSMSSRRLRRSWLSLALGALLMPGAVSPAVAGDTGRQVQRYRADAVIRILTIPIIRRSGVGSGFALLEKTKPGPVDALRLLFAAGSLPDHAHGLNRMGYIEEIVEEREDGPEVAHYFGFMTSSREQTIEEGQNALSSDEGNGPYSVVQGEARSDSYSATKAHFRSDKSYRWPDWTSVLPEARQAAAESLREGKTKKGHWKHGGAPPLPMLYTLLSAIRADPEVQERRFIWEDQEYQLTVAKELDPSMGERLAERSLTDRPGSIVRLVGKVINTRTGKRSTFRLWYDKDSGSALPLRVEYRPRQFLQLTFEADPGLPPDKEPL